ncbi:MAG: hypothetical protein IPP22_10355 [Nitrosomonas sp.]|nr:hypothetical protein [Nitrosomonas sp.]
MNQITVKKYIKKILIHAKRSMSLVSLHPYSFTIRNRNALTITLTDDSDIVAAAKIGDSKMPKNGYSTPTAIGTPAI